MPPSTTGFARPVASLGPVSTSRILYERSFLRNGLMYARRAWIAPDRTRPAADYQGVFGYGKDSRMMTFASDDHRRATDPAKLAKAMAAIREASTLCRRNGVKLIVVFVPTKYRVYRDMCRFPHGLGVARDRPRRPARQAPRGRREGSMARSSWT